MKGRLLLIGLVAVLALVAGAAPAALALGIRDDNSHSAADGGSVVAASALQLYTGWNFVPYTGGACTGARDAFTPLINPGVFNIAWHHNNTTKVWTSFDWDVPDVINDLTQLCPNDVLVINVSADIIWNP